MKRANEVNETPWSCKEKREAVTEGYTQLLYRAFLLTFTGIIVSGGLCLIALIIKELWEIIL